MHITISLNEKKSIKVEKLAGKQYEIKHADLSILAEEEQLEELCWELIGRFPHLMKDEYQDKLDELKHRINELEDELQMYEDNV